MRENFRGAHRRYETSPQLIIGLECQTQETKTFATGIERVVRVGHEFLYDNLKAEGHELGAVFTVDLPRTKNFLRDELLGSDPILRGPERKLSEVDLLVILEMPGILNAPALFREKRRRGLKILSIVFDALPVTNPEWFPEEAHKNFRVYLQSILGISDHIVVNSETVLSRITALGWKTKATFHVIPLGAFNKNQTTPRERKANISALYVSTVEPRKGHQTILDAYELLRQDDVDIRLMFAGREGWLVDSLSQRIQTHPDFGGRLRWVRGASDHEVENMALRSNMGLILSEDEGFGLFLEEALSYGLPTIASNIPVFKERPYRNLHFSERNASDLASTMLETHRLGWLGEKERIRSMDDFGEDLSELVIEILREMA